jgi:catechol 2,3-dioxygenase-like lactoylglutathione lyase family enzyme
MNAKITALHSIELQTPDLAAACKFYQNVWGLEEVAGAEGVHYFRGTGPHHHILTVRGGAEPAVVAVNFLADDVASIDQLQQKLVSTLNQDIATPTEINRPGGGYGFAFKDIAQRNIQIMAEVQEHGQTADIKGRPRKLSHAIFNSDESELSSKFYQDELGFKLTDFTKGLDFLRCDTTHHSIGITRNGGSTLNHVAFLMPEWDSVMRGAGRMKAAGFELEWGIGRHGPGNNIFAYFVGPDGMAIEFTAEVEEIEDDHQVRGIEDWLWLSERHEQWGLAGPRSDNLKKAFKFMPFTDTLPG